jgi:hypothetical protein
MASYTLTISDNNGVPVGSGLSVPDYTVQGGNDVPNAVIFSNTTAKTIILTGGDNWSTFFSQNSLTIASGDTPSLTLTLDKSMTGSVPLAYSLQYQGEADSLNKDNPIFLVIQG